MFVTSSADSGRARISPAHACRAEALAEVERGVAGAREIRGRFEAIASHKILQSCIGLI